MKLVTSEQMRKLEQKSADAGVSVDMLMENAGLAELLAGQAPT